MLKTTYFTGIIALIFLLSCNGNDNKKGMEIESLKTEVIGVHDEVMPKMDKIMQLKAQLQEHINITSDSIPTDSLTVARKLLLDLEEADESMMMWMRKYDPMMEGMDEEEKLNYLEKNKESIEIVKQQMLSAISDSEEFLKQRK